MSLYDHEVTEVLNRIIDQIPEKNARLKQDLYELAQYVDMRKDYMVQLESEIEILKMKLGQLVDSLESADLVIEDMDDALIKAARELSQR